jgi:DNA-binding CsgD family transcriptional regulator
MSTNIISQATRTVPHHDEAAVEPADLWSALVSGRARIVDSGVTEAHHYFQLVKSNPAPCRTALSDSRVRMFERVLLGDAPKVVAIEAGCSTSTVATAVGDCLSAMGLERRCSRVPALLVLMLHALRGKASRVAFHVESAPGQREDRQLVSSARLELCLTRRLSASELAVVSLLVEGKNHVEIARHRGSAARTVANQIASVYRKLGISGRIDLLCYLVATSTAAN